MDKENNNQPKNNNTVLIIITVLIVVLVIGAIIVFALIGYFQKQFSTNNNQSSNNNVTQTQTTTPVATATQTPDQTDYVFDYMTASDSVVTYLTSVLGTIPGGYIDYDFASQYLYTDLADRLINDSSFVPSSLCIQNGPDDIMIESETTDPDEIYSYVTVSALYGDTYEPMWEFYLESGPDYWVIKSITCLQTGQVTQ